MNVFGQTKYLKQHNVICIAKADISFIIIRKMKVQLKVKYAICLSVAYIIFILWIIKKNRHGTGQSSPLNWDKKKTLFMAVKCRIWHF